MKRSSLQCDIIPADENPYLSLAIGLEQLEYARPWLSTYNVVAVRKAISSLPPA